MKQSIVFLLVVCWLAACGGVQRHSTVGDSDLTMTFKRALDSLDGVSLRRNDFVVRKEAYIDSLKRAAARRESSDVAKYALVEQLSTLYTSYQSDSAMVYLMRGIDIADKIGDVNLKIRSKSNLALLYAYNGRHYESNQMLESIVDTAKMDYDASLAYYIAWHRLCRELYTWVESPQSKRELRSREMYYCRQIMSECRDEQLLFTYGYFDATCRSDWFEASALCDSLLRCVPRASHSYAKAANHKAVVCSAVGQAELANIWVVRAAIADTQAAIKDYGALSDVAQMLFEMGEVKQAMKYMRLVIQDTRFFYSSVRALRNIAVLPQIEHAYNQHNERLRLMWIVLIGAMLLFVVTLGGAMFYILRQNRRLNAARITLSESNGKLQLSSQSLLETNRRLRLLNARIADANNIKEAYIGSFMMIFSEYINKLADIQRRVSRLVREENLAELKSQYGVAAVKYDELKEFYMLFDSVFLHLYPTFVEEFNRLLKVEARVSVRNANTLSTDLRVFALIRLGFSDTSQIASLLHCSINTVYNYRSRLRLQAVDADADFEAQVMQIGIPTTNM